MLPHARVQAEAEDRVISPAGTLVQMFMQEWRYNSGSTQGNDCSSHWSPPITNDLRYLVPFFPENKAAYWLFAFDREQVDKDIMLRIKGRFPHARYASFTLYDGASGKLVRGTPALKDVELQPQAGSVNPFQAGVARSAENRDYALTVVPAASAKASAGNVLRIPDSVRYPMLVLRVYRADEGRSLEGGTGLPSVHVFEAASGKAVARCPAPVFPVAKGLDASKRPDTRRYYAPDIHFYAKHPEYSGLFGNPHNYYGQTGLSRQYGDVAVMRFKVPSTPDTASGGGVTADNVDLRYWSMCIGGDVFTNTSSCLWDDVAVVDAQGYVKLAVGPDTEAFRKAAAERGYNAMAWGHHLRHVLYHRHMQGERYFEQSYKQAPNIDFNKPLSPQRADRYIGEYAPTGFYCSESAFLAGDCGHK